MTIDELVEELQAEQAKGHGDFEVLTHEWGWVSPGLAIREVTTQPDDTLVITVEPRKN